MADFYRNTDRTIVLYTRDDTPIVYARIKRPDNNGWIIKSTKTPDKVKAQAWAENQLDEMRLKNKFSLALDNHSVAEVAKEWIKTLDAKLKNNQITKQRYNEITGCVERYIIPFFKKREIATIDEEDIAAFVEWRRDYWISGPGKDVEELEYVQKGKKIKRPVKKAVPTKRTLGLTMTQLRALFDFAKRKKYLRASQIPDIKLEKKKRTMLDMKPAFTPAEIPALIAHLEKWVDEPKARNTHQRLVLLHMVRFLIASGIRPGTETDNLQFKHLDWRTSTEGTKRLIATLEGKVGSRKAVVGFLGSGTIASLRIDWATKFGRAVTPDDYVFSLPDQRLYEPYLNDLFTRALVKGNMLKDVLGQPRTLYALRRTYGTIQLLENNANVFKLAKQMGTSVAVIEQHYAHILAEMNIEDFA